MPVQGKRVEDPDQPYKPNRVQITTMVSHEVRNILKRVKVDRDISFGKAIDEAVLAYWKQYAETQRG